MLANPLDIKECPDCASTNIGKSEIRDQVICRECGLIFEPLDPETEETYEKTHDITMGGKTKTAKASAKSAKTSKKKK